MCLCCNRKNLQTLTTPHTHSIFKPAEKKRRNNQQHEKQQQQQRTAATGNRTNENYRDVLQETKRKKLKTLMNLTSFGEKSSHL